MCILSSLKKEAWPIHEFHEFVYLETSSKLNDAKCLLLHLGLSILLSKQSWDRHSISAVYAVWMQAPSASMVGKLLALILYFMIAGVRNVSTSVLTVFILSAVISTFLKGHYLVALMALSKETYRPISQGSSSDEFETGPLIARSRWSPSCKDLVLLFLVAGNLVLAVSTFRHGPVQTSASHPELSRSSYSISKGKPSK